MPTGYTAEIQDEDFNLNEWLKKSIARAFGTLICLRGAGRMSEKQIIKELEKNAKNAGKYHKKELKKIEKLEKEYDNYTQKDWEKLREDEIVECMKDIASDLGRKDNGRNKYRKVLDELNEIKPKTKNTIAQPMVDFAIQQINDSINFDYLLESTYYKEKLDSIKEMPNFKYSKEEELLKDKVYHIKKLIEDQNREKGRLRNYKEYVKIIDGVCKC